MYVSLTRWKPAAAHVRNSNGTRRTRRGQHVMYRIKRHKRHHECETNHLCGSMKGDSRRRRLWDVNRAAVQSDSPKFDGEKETEEGELTPLQSDSNCTEHMPASDVSLPGWQHRQTGTQDRDASCPAETASRSTTNKRAEANTIGGETNRASICRRQLHAHIARPVRRSCGCRRPLRLRVNRENDKRENDSDGDGIGSNRDSELFRMQTRILSAKQTIAHVVRHVAGSIATCTTSKTEQVARQYQQNAGVHEPRPPPHTSQRSAMAGAANDEGAHHQVSVGSACRRC